MKNPSGKNSGMILTVVYFMSLFFLFAGCGAPYKTYNLAMPGISMENAPCPVMLNVDPKGDGSRTIAANYNRKSKGLAYSYETNRGNGWVQKTTVSSHSSSTDLFGIGDKLLSQRNDTEKCLYIMDMELQTKINFWFIGFMGGASMSTNFNVTAQPGCIRQ